MKAGADLRRQMLVLGLLRRRGCRCLLWVMKRRRLVWQRAEGLPTARGRRAVREQAAPLLLPRGGMRGMRGMRGGGGREGGALQRCHPIGGIVAVGKRRMR